jgi:hypothetical protein
MRRSAVLTALLGAALLAALLGASTASATVLCKTATNPCTGGTYGKGTTIAASLKSGTKSVLDTPFGNVECSEASIEGGVTNAGGEAGNVSGSVNTLSFGSCPFSTVTVLKKGSFTIKSPSEGNGTLALEGFEITVAYSGFHCIYSATASLPLKGGSMASIGTSATLARTGGSSGAFCGSTATWTVDYTVTAPEPLYVAEKEETPTVLCKTATNPCTGGTYGKGTTIAASLKSGTKSVLDTPFGNVECSEASIEGGVTNAGGEAGNVSGSVNTLSFGSCPFSTVTVLKKGSFTIKSPSEGNGTLALEGFEITVAYSGFHCIYSATASLPLKGGSMASIGTSATLARTGGSSGAFCGSTATWTVDYTVTAPEPLYVAEF